MSLVLLSLVKMQSRNLLTAEDTLIQGYIDAAEAHAQKYLNRNVYADATALANAKAAQTAAAAQAIQDTYDAALAAAGALKTGWAADSATAAADEAFNAACEAWMAVTFGMVINPTFVQAILLIVATWYANREAVLTDTNQVVELPWGAKALLDFDRRQMGA